MSLLLMIEILHHLKDPKLWELWSIPYYGVVLRIYRAYIINRRLATLRFRHGTRLSLESRRLPLGFL